MINTAGYVLWIVATLLLLVVVSKTVQQDGRYERMIIRCPECGDWEWYEHSMADRLHLQVGDDMPYHCQQCGSAWVVELVEWEP